MSDAAGALAEASSELSACIGLATEVIEQRHALARSRETLALATVQLRTLAAAAAARTPVMVGERVAGGTGAAAPVARVLQQRPA